MRATSTRRRRGSGHELREVVIQSATDLLAQLGDVDALTMRAVATASGVTPPSVYRHFPDKRALVREVISERFSDFTNLLRNAADSAGEQPLPRLEAMTWAYIQFGQENPGHYRVLFSTTNADPTGLGLSPEAEHPGKEAHLNLVESVCECLPVSAKELAPALATELWASLHGILDLQITKPDMSWPESETFIDAVLTPVRTAAQP